MEAYVTLPAKLDSLSPLAQWLAQQMAPLPVSEEWRYSLDLAVCEAASNVIRHALGELSHCRFTVTFTRLVDGVQVRLADTGRPMPETALQRAQNKIGRDTEMDAEGGRGLMLILQCVDSFLVERRNGENQTTLVKRLK